MKILFVYQALATFVKKDLDILSSVHSVREIHFKGMKDIPKLCSGVKWCDVTFSWFGSLHAFFTVLFSRIFGKKAIVVAGGWDLGQSPDGLMFQPTKRWCPSYVFSNADLVLTVSDYNTLEAIVNLKSKIKKVRKIYHGFDANYLKNVSTISKKREMVLTVSSVAQYQIFRKGLELFTKTAGLMPESKFVLAGEWADESIESLRKLASSNMLFTGWLSDNDLRLLYNEAGIYVQASVHEAFGCSLAEAMLHECVPVVSRLGSIPEVVGECGIYLDELTPEELAEKIREAQNRPELGKMARERIVRLFPLQKRAQELLHAIEEVRKL